MGNDFQVGDKVIFGRGNGEQTLGTVVKVNRVKLKVRQDESRGTMKSYPVGTIWTVPPSLLRKANGTAAPAAKAKRPNAEILAAAERIMWQLEPEVLYCDGERSRSQAHRAAASLRRQFQELEMELGRRITEFGSIDGAMPANPLTYGNAKESGWRPGDKVAFDAKGSTVVGFVKRVNRKTVSVQPVGGGSRYWRVSPGMLRAA